jgi:hypothetical protein
MDGKNPSPSEEHTKQAKRNRVEQIPSSLWTQGVSTVPDGRDRGCASQFDPAIDKNRKLISNLRWNMSVLVHRVPNIWPSGQQDMPIN